MYFFCVAQIERIKQEKTIQNKQANALIDSASNTNQPTVIDIELEDAALAPLNKAMSFLKKPRFFKPLFLNPGGYSPTMVLKQLTKNERKLLLLSYSFYVIPLRLRRRSCFFAYGEREGRIFTKKIFTNKSTSKFNSASCALFASLPALREGRKRSEGRVRFCKSKSEVSGKG
jgi:hypothetical protein